jgi:hypothetical protein
MSDLDRRMLLSHNFDLQDDRLSPLTRAEFAAVFSNGFTADTGVECRLLNNPHWIVEVKYTSDRYTPTAIGLECARVLADFRRQSIADRPLPDILILGGIKTTPSTNPSPDSLQSNEWGSDVVETNSSTEFLTRIGWEHTIANRDPATIIAIENGQLM